MNSLKALLKKLSQRISLQEQVMFVRHLSVMARAGIPLLDSLGLIQKQTKSKTLASILETVVHDVSNGQFLSNSLEQYRNIFGNLFINIIRVGEAGGNLPENLNYLADELKKKAALKKKVIGALVYPVVILVATFGITGLLIVFIFPKILPVFISLKITLPFTTRVLILISDVLTKQGHFFLLGVIAVVLVFWLLLKNYNIRFFLHKFLLHIPIASKMALSLNLANFSRTLGLLLKSGIKIVEAISITGSTLNNLVYQKELKELAESVGRGSSLTKYFETKPKTFPPVLSQMVTVGENSGNLSETLLYMSEFYESEVEDFTKNLSTILEPLMMVLMGTMVGFVAIAIITPIYEITKTVGTIKR